MLTAGSDWVVTRSSQRRFFERLGSPVKHLEVLPGFYHDVYHEADATRPLRLTRQFIEASFASRAEPESLLDAHEKGYTFDEYRTLVRPLMPLSIKWMTYTSFGIFMRTLGRLSAGIRLGWRADSIRAGRWTTSIATGQPAHASGPADRSPVLNGIGWRGIRVADGCSSMSCEAIEQTHARKGSVHVVDIAAGAGRYLLETLKRCDSLKVTAELRDAEPANSKKARRRRFTGLQNVVFIKADAFDPSSFEGLRPRSDIAIVSGLYELFPDNAQVLAAQGPGASGARRRFRLRTSRGTQLNDCSWPVRLEREAVDHAPPTQGEMDDLMRAAGFEKRQMEIDPWACSRCARHPRALNAWTALGLSVLFVAVYGATGWITSLRPDVGTWAFEWEHRLPFVAWYIECRSAHRPAPACAGTAVAAVDNVATTATVARKRPNLRICSVPLPVLSRFLDQRRPAGRPAFRDPVRLRSAIQPVSVTAHRHSDDSVGGLPPPPYAWHCPMAHMWLVRSDRRVNRPDVSASRHRSGWRISPGAPLLLPDPKPEHAAAARDECANRLLAAASAALAWSEHGCGRWDSCFFGLRRHSRLAGGASVCMPASLGKRMAGCHSLPGSCWRPAGGCTYR